MLTYPGTITLPESTPDFLAGLLQANRERLGTWRKLPARGQALLVLAHLRNGSFVQSYSTGPPATNLLINGVFPGTTYFVDMYAHNLVGYGAPSARSNTVTAT